MRTVSAALLLLLLPAYATAHDGGGSQPAGRETNTAISDAAKTVDAFHDALAKGDRQAAQALLDDTVHIYEQGWVERSKAEYASHHLESDAKFSAATTSMRTARTGTILGDLAYVSTEAKVTGTFAGKPIDSVTLETMILQRAQGVWRIAHIHWSSRDNKK
jgi:ketosteroid isomerase-like protein